MAKLKPQITGK